MDTKTAQMTRWLCQMYNTRGYGFTDDDWKQFAKFCEENGFTDEPLPGKRKDGQNQWDLFQNQLIG